MMRGQKKTTTDSLAQLCLIILKITISQRNPTERLKEKMKQLLIRNKSLIHI